MYISKELQKKIDDNLKFIAERQNGFESAKPDVDKMEREIFLLERMLRDIAIHCACSFIPFSWRNDYAIGDEASKKMKDGLKEFRKS